MSEASSHLRENKMGVMPINRLLISMSLPMMISMLVQALYNVVDSIFVSYISENALTAVSLAFPVQSLMVSVCVGTGVGINAALSKSLGEKDFEAANRCANNGLFLALLSFLVFAVLGGLFSRPYFMLQTDITDIVDLGTTYLTICTVFCFGMMFQVTLNRLLQSTGQTFYIMFTQGLGAIVNIVFDPLLIFGIGPFPRLGMTGAAIATVIGQITGCSLSLFFNLTKNHEIHLAVRGFRPHGPTIRRIYAVGFPSIILASIGSVMTFAINRILLAFSTTAAAVFGIYFKLQSFVFMPVFGLNNGMVPIIAYNYGARKKSRMVHTIRLSILYAVCIMALGTALFWLIPDRLLGLFNASSALLAIGVPALRTISLSFILAAFGIITSSTCQAVGHGMLSMSVSVVRQLLAIIPAAYLLAHFFGLNAVWWAFPIAEVFSFALSAFYMRYIYRSVIEPLEELKPLPSE
ncbi:MAG: MATE family efflux transporter [Intestinimonas sp.]|nr:MATE family efflux transporter [Intestinimonas sp.]